MFKAVMAKLTYWRKCNQVSWLEFLNQILCSRKLKKCLVKRSRGLETKNSKIALLGVLLPILQALEKIWKKDDDLTHRLQITYKVSWHLQMADALTEGIKFYVYIVRVYSAGTSRKSHRLPSKRLY